MHYCTDVCIIVYIVYIFKIEILCNSNVFVESLFIKYNGIQTVPVQLQLYSYKGWERDSGLF